ncbi:AAA family ATPase [Cocleimonas sp. KMM 6892]|uniref:AAA family ATPase n=1 Tax=unclassified Cocleimonas TaxID=2639732 RepID=UPI002DBF1911|nr:MULTISPECIES: AAA family ATPase [unclassified Cocleimonas]MEB8433873.1 AAA family ATPase [Cocleimonas sp. KMM 6892]MEC4716684.1 AAA family ATPase [Cocleimonas sp. KMM 6895]MEC4746161.1 AAA family ATPase [Cocleimonas sp. KMM 6896]
MSNLYRLEKIIFNNFKLFGEEFTVNFNDNLLVVLDGPNGHGKTTVYDAIELALTGGIRRFNSTEKQQIPKDVVVAYEDREDCFVRLELSNNKNRIIIERHLKNDFLNIDKKISNFKKLWNLYLLSNDDRQIISQEKLNELIDSPNLERDFTLFHYVEQEDTAHFLKQKTESERAKALSVLFGDTVEMQQKVNKVELVFKQLDKTLKDKVKDKLAIESKGNINVSEETKESNISFKPLLQWKEGHFEWDREKIKAFTIEKKDIFLSELYNIETLLKYREYFIRRGRHNRATQSSILRSFVAYSQYINELDQLKEKSRQINVVTNIKSLLNVDNFNDLLNSPLLDEAFTLVNYEYRDEFLKTLKKIVEGKSRNQDSSKLVLELLGYRNHLKIHLSNQEKEKECFLCGTDFDDHTQLIHSIDQKELALKSLLTDDEKRLEILQSSFLETIFPKFLANVTEYLTNTIGPTPEHIIELEQTKDLTQRFRRLEMWLNKEEIIFSDLLLTYKPANNSEDEIEESVSLLKDRILEKVKQSPEGYDESNEDVNFENVFKIYFDANSKNLVMLNSQDIEQKSLYIQQLFFESISSDIKAYESIKLEISKLESNIEVIKRLRKGLNSAVKRYQKLLIKDIEVPFYIYSGKVLQSHQSNIGNGIFIKDRTGGEELKNIRFVSNWKSDHDIINTMSSGQIAAVVITLYLALNKIYTKGLGTLLIDDPVQTMDEINMISLVELLRNEFSDRQIILSTHEDHVSRYFIYKFLKYQCSVRQIKLIDRKEYQLSNQLPKG